jgi:hypothetical protein
MAAGAPFVEAFTQVAVTLRRLRERRSRIVSTWGQAAFPNSFERLELAIFAGNIEHR